MNVSGPRSSQDSLSLLEALLAAKRSGRNRSNRTDFDPSFLSNYADVGLGFAILFVVLACIAIVLNGTILAIMCQHHRKVFKHVFYILIVNFTLIDILKSFCLVLWALRTFMPASGSIGILKVDQITLIVLRFCNLGTVLNLLMITFNEFVFIKYPLRYRTLVTKGRVQTLVFVSWILSWSFTVFTMVASSKQHTFFLGPCPDEGNLTQSDNIPTTESSRRCVVRMESKDSMNVQYLVLIILISFCAFCLVVVVVCYAIFFRVIRRIQLQDSAQYLETQHSTSDGRNSICELSSGDQHRINRQLLRRHKYVLVIGSVILVYMIYLISYSSIQILQVKRLAGVRFSQQTSLIIRWSLQTMIGLHSIFQPLCYFRMKEFRHFFFKSLGYPCKSSSIRRDSATFLSESVLPSRLRKSEGIMSASTSEEHLNLNRQTSSNGRSSDKHVTFGRLLSPPRSLRRKVLNKNNNKGRETRESSL